MHWNGTTLYKVTLPVCANSVWHVGRNTYDVKSIFRATGKGITLFVHIYSQNIIPISKIIVPSAINCTLMLKYEKNFDKINGFSFVDKPVPCDLFWPMSTIFTRVSCCWPITYVVSYSVCSRKRKMAAPTAAECGVTALRFSTKFCVMHIASSKKSNFISFKEDNWTRRLYYK